MTDLSRSLVDAAATGMHNARCVCRRDTHPATYREAASVAVAAVLETLDARAVMFAERDRALIRQLIVEVKQEGRDDTQ